MLNILPDDAEDEDGETLFEGIFFENPEFIRASQPDNQSNVITEANEEDEEEEIDQGEAYTEDEEDEPTDGEESEYTIVEVR